MCTPHRSNRGLPAGRQVGPLYGRPPNVNSADPPKSTSPAYTKRPRRTIPRTTFSHYPQTPSSRPSSRPLPLRRRDLQTCRSAPQHRGGPPQHPGALDLAAPHDCPKPNSAPHPPRARQAGRRAGRRPGRPPVGRPRRAAPRPEEGRRRPRAGGAPDAAPSTQAQLRGNNDRHVKPGEVSASANTPKASLRTRADAGLRWLP
jgi:hypothetical protein